MKVIGHYSLRGRIPSSEWNQALPILLDLSRNVILGEYARGGNVR